MILKSHNDNTKEFLQKLLLYIDSTISSAVSADAVESQKIITRGLTNLKDAILSEIVRDNCIDQINEATTQSSQKKELDQSDISQEIESDKDQ